MVDSSDDPRSLFCPDNQPEEFEAFKACDPGLLGAVENGNVQHATDSCRYIYGVGSGSQLLICLLPKNAPVSQLSLIGLQSFRVNCDLINSYL